MSDKTIRVLVMEPGKDPYVREIDSSLRAMQELVGGPIQCVPILDEPGPGFAEIVCNEEGKLRDLTPNRLLNDDRGVPYDVLLGTFFVVSEQGEDFASLSDAQIAVYMKKYSREKLEPIPGQPDKFRPAGSRLTKEKGGCRHER